MEAKTLNRPGLHAAMIAASAGARGSQNARS